MKRQLFILALGLTITLMVSSCKKDNPVVPPVEPPAVLKDTVTLSITGVTHRSVDVNVQCTMNNAQYSVLLYRRLNNTDTLAAEYPVEAADTTITDDNNGEGLLLDTEYKYYAVTRDSTGEIKDTSNTVSARTLPVTSHNYTWQEYTIGGFGSALYDVWGTDENNVYAVGGVTINDTTYGIIKWDGVQWRGEKRIGGQYTVYGFSASDIWTAGEGVYHFNGVEWKQVDAKTVNSQSIPLDSVLYHNKPYTSIWGTSSSNLYLGSTWGKIVHWDGTKAEVIKDFSDFSVRDIFGLNDNFILTPVATVSQGKVHLYDGMQWQKLPGLNENRLYESVYAVSPKEFYVVGEQILLNRNGVWSEPVNTEVYMECIRGNVETGDIIAAGHFSTLYHYNGIDWESFQFQLSSYNPISGLYLTKNKVFAVGPFGNQARIIIGTRN